MKCAIFGADVANRCDYNYVTNRMINMKRLENLTGQRFEKLTVTKYLGKDKYYNKIWECQCNGVQHYEPVEFFGGIERFKIQQRHDLLKLHYAESHGFSYLVLDCRRENVPHIEVLLRDFINKH